MIDISQYTNQIASAIYGRDVRQSIVDGLTACANTAGLEVLGSYASLAELQAAHPTGNTGDYYIAGLDLYYWNGKAWEDVSQFTGVGITGISKTSTSVLNDTYTITYSDSTTSTFTVTNGNGIESFAKTSTSGLVDTYTITFTNGSTQAVEITNGKGIQSIAKTSTAGLVDTYTITFTDSTTQTFTVTNGYTPTLAVHQNADMSVTVTLTDQSGTTTVTIPASSYTLPVASSTDLGGVKSGNDISVSTAGVVSVSHASTADNATQAQNAVEASRAGDAEGYTSDGAIASALDTKADATAMASALALKADQTSLDTTNSKLTRDVTNLTVPASAFVADTTFTNYPFKADITVAGATSNDVPDVQPSQDASDLGILGGKSLAGAGIVTIYANAVPSAAIVIDRITLRKENI